MDIASVIHRRLKQLGLGQRDLALAAEVTESYISQLLAKKKLPPASDRTDIYTKIGKLIRLPEEELSRLADTQRRDELKRKVLDLPQPLFREFRELVLRKCAEASRKRVAHIFERETFGEFERFVMQKLLDVSKRVAKEELDDEEWIHRLAAISKRSYEETRVGILEFLDTDIFHVSGDNCVSFVDPVLERWDIEFESFGMEIVLNRKLSRDRFRKFEFQESLAETESEIEPGLENFLKDAKLSGGVTEEEAAFLKRLRFTGKRPSALYYYRELQNLRDPLNFLPGSLEKRRKKVGPPRVAGLAATKGVRGRKRQSS